ncbi:MAG TPA: hypothetical protein VM008_19115 [Phycisphaerae bacterium]|nr:hypothetical protein [Phycisphaerae bacterium]
MKTLSVAVGVVLGLAGMSKANSVINLTPVAFPNFATAADFGQTFTVPAGNNTVLSSFAFYAMGSGGNISFDAELYQIDPLTSKIAGPMLYESSVRVALNNLTRQTFTFATGEIPLVSGDAYFAVMHQMGYGNVGNLQVSSSSDPYSGGYGVWLSSNSNRYASGGASWSSSPLVSELGFNAVFVTPLPASFYGGLVMLGVAAAVSMKLRRTV